MNPPLSTLNVSLRSLDGLLLLANIVSQKRIVKFNSKADRETGRQNDAHSLAVSLQQTPAARQHR